MAYSSLQKAKFFARLIRPFNGDDCCWLWKGGKDGRGRGWLYLELQVSIKASIMSYEVFVGPRNGLQVLHKCDNERCVNPDHLFLGTSRDNNLDCLRKGRARCGQGAIPKPVILTDYEI